MVPPPALRKRMQAAASGNGASLTHAAGSRKEAKPRMHSSYLLGGAIGVIGVCGMLYQRTLQPDITSEWAEADSAPIPEAAALMSQANNAIRAKYNYTLAHDLLKRALKLDRNNTSIQHSYASSLLALDKVEEAWNIFRALFNARSAVAKTPSFLQQYVLSLQRLAKHQELQEVWPIILAIPDVMWTTPLQCPDFVDESLLAGAMPFPSQEGLRVPRLLHEHREKIISEFQKFWGDNGEQSQHHFKVNQDGDLVEGTKVKQWTEMLLFDRGVWDPLGCGDLPTACKILRGLLEVEGIANGKRSGQVSLLKLEEGAHLVPHYGSVNWRYTAHLGLLVPPGVTMYAGNESRQFAHGEVLLLDDSFLHSVEHAGSGPRITLFVNFFHPKVQPMTHEEWLDRRDRR